jgi:hypothetical protein
LVLFENQIFQLDARFSSDEGGRRLRLLPQQWAEILAMPALTRRRRLSAAGAIEDPALPGTTIPETRACQLAKTG